MGWHSVCAIEAVLVGAIAYLVVQMHEVLERSKDDPGDASGMMMSLTFNLAIAVGVG